MLPLRWTRKTKQKIVKRRAALQRWALQAKMLLFFKCTARSAQLCAAFLFRSKGSGRCLSGAVSVDTYRNEYCIWMRRFSIATFDNLRGNSGVCSAVIPKMQHQSYQWAEGGLGVLGWVSRIRWTQPHWSLVYSGTQVHPGLALVQRVTLLALALFSHL